MKKNLGKIIYLISACIIPIAIVIFSKICNGIDKQTKIFLAITLAMYIVGIILIYPILNIKEKIKYVIDEYNNAESEKSYKSLLKIIEDCNSDYIKEPFDEYKKTLKRVKNGINEQGEEISIYYSTNDIDVYFNEENTIYKNICDRTINQITQGLTAVGMFGTFLGIVQGVSKLNLENSETMKIGIATLLSGVKVSFNSSLYGIMFSVILTFLMKVIIDLTMKDINKFCSLVSKLIYPYTEQSALSDVENELKKQTSTFEQLASTLVEEMSKNFEQSIKESLDSLSGNINDAIDEMQGKIAASINDNTAQTIVGLTATMKPVLEKLESTISNFEVNQQQTTGKFFEESISSIKDAINIGTNDEVTRLKDSMDAISEKNSDMLETFTKSMESMKELTLYQESLLKNTTNSTESMNMTTENIRELQNNLSQVILNLKDVHSSSNVSLGNIQETVNLMQASMAKQLEASTAIDEMLAKSNRLGESQEKYIMKFESISNNMSKNIESTQSLMNALNTEMNSYKSYFDSIKNSTIEVASTLDLKYKNITDNIDNANNNLIDTVDSIKTNILDKVSSTSNVLNEVTISLNNYQHKSHELLGRIEKFAEVEESTQELWKNYKESFDNLNENINEGIVNYTRSVSDSVNTLFSEYDTNISNAVTELKKMVELLNDSADNIAESLEIVGTQNNSNE